MQDLHNRVVIRARPPSRLDSDPDRQRPAQPAKRARKRSRERAICVAAGLAPLFLACGQDKAASAPRAAITLQAPITRGPAQHRGRSLAARLELPLAHARDAKTQALLALDLDGDGRDEIIAATMAPGSLQIFGGVSPAIRPVVDPRVIPIGEPLYIPEFDGMILPDGSIHDGCVRADDTGGGIKGRKMDFFVVTYGNFRFLLESLLNVTWITPHVEAPRCQYLRDL